MSSATRSTIRIKKPVTETSHGPDQCPISLRLQLPANAGNEHLKHGPQQLAGPRVSINEQYHQVGFHATEDWGFMGSECLHFSPRSNQIGGSPRQNLVIARETDPPSAHVDTLLTRFSHLLITPDFRDVEKYVRGKLKWHWQRGRRVRLGCPGRAVDPFSTRLAYGCS